MSKINVHHVKRIVLILCACLFLGIQAQATQITITKNGKIIQSPHPIQRDGRIPVSVHYEGNTLYIQGIWTFKDCSLQVINTDGQTVCQDILSIGKQETLVTVPQFQAGFYIRLTIEGDVYEGIVE